MRIEERPSVGGYDQPSSYAYNLVATFWNCCYEKMEHVSNIEHNLIKQHFSLKRKMDFHAQVPVGSWRRPCFFFLAMRTSTTTRCCGAWTVATAVVHPYGRRVCLPLLSKSMMLSLSHAYCSYGSGKRAPRSCQFRNHQQKPYLLA